MVGDAFAGRSLLSRTRYDETDSRVFALAKPPAFIFLHGPRSDLSSTALRAKAELRSR